MDQHKPVFLSDLRPGARGRVLRVSGEGETSRRIADMGMTAGALIEVKRIAPMGDPMEVLVRGYHLSLRRAEAMRITVTVE